MTTPPIPADPILEPPPMLEAFEPPPRETPRAMDLLVLAGVLFLAGIVVFLVGAVAMSVYSHAHHFAPKQMSKAQTFAFAIPLQALWYLLAFAIAVPIYRSRWQRSFSAGIHWNGMAARSRLWMLMGCGLLLSIFVQIISIKIHMPKTAPVYDLFRFPALAWGVTVFGIFVAPAAEELFFRGFLLPIVGRWAGNAVAVVLTSVLFALMHASQIGHAWGAVAVLFAVSVVLCLFRLQFRSVAVSTVVHMSYNAVLFIAMIVVTRGYTHLDKIPH
jgi:membrane protease YdiL (CAAX protease family)